MLTKRGTKSIVLIVRLSRSSRSGVQTPPCLQRLRHLSGLAELQVTSLLRDDGALVHGGQLGRQLSLKSAGLLWVEVTHLLGDIDQGRDDLVMALLGSLLEGTASSADLNGKLLTGGVSHELAGLLLHVLGAAGGLVHSPALLGTLAVTDLLHWLVALLHSLVVSLLLECAEMKHVTNCSLHTHVLHLHAALLLEVLLADFLLAGSELSDVGVVALLHVLVSTLQDGLLLQAGHGLLLLDAAEPSLRVLLAAAEVNAALNVGNCQ